VIRLLTGDCREVLATLPACSVHCVVTSPPYYGLRDYGTAQWEGGGAACDHARLGTKVSSASTLRLDGRDHIGPYDGEKATRVSYPFADICGKCGARRIDRQIGLEASPDEYLATMVEVFREVKRVLRDDGTCWVNVGDSYNANQGTAFDTNRDGGGRKNFTMSPKVSSGGLAPKQLLLMPARLALALQADGWWVRSDIIWAKPNPMPESCTDRPTSAHEHVFLLSKAARYFYDADAVREAQSEGTIERFGNGNAPRKPAVKQGGTDRQSDTWRDPVGVLANGRNLRNVWTIATQAFPDVHYATFPTALVERCIRAGTSERGCCAACGAPWCRVTETNYTPGGPKHSGNAKALRYIRDGEREDSGYKTRHDTTTGWSPGCTCDAGVVPCTVLDPFIGSGTTALVADRLQRNAIGIDLNTDYARMAQERITKDCPMFVELPPAGEQILEQADKQLALL